MSDDWAIELNLGAPGAFRWRIDRAALCVYLNPVGGLDRAVWQLESGAGPQFACVFAVGVEGRILYPPGGERLLVALRAAPGFDSACFARAEGAIAAGTAGRFVCWERPRRPA